MAADQWQFCRHCKRRKIRKRDSAKLFGLCFLCYKDVDVRSLYTVVPFKSLLKKAPPLAKEGTGAMPGSAEKMEVMRQRVARGEQVCHPDDATEWTFDDGGDN